MDHIAGRLVLFGVAAFGFVVLAACGGGDKTPTATTAGRVVSMSGSDYSFEAPDRIPGGQVSLRFTNKGQETHDLHLMRFNDGASIHQFQQTLHQGGGLEAALRLVSDSGHVAAVGPDQTAEATVDLSKGEYVLICQVTSPSDGVAHALKGMVKPLTVTAAL